MPPWTWALSPVIEVAVAVAASRIRRFRTWTYPEEAFFKALVERAVSDLYSSKSTQVMLR
jgi:hypothetical protein